MTPVLMATFHFRKIGFFVASLFVILLSFHEEVNAIYSTDYNPQLGDSLNVPYDCGTESVDTCSRCTRQCGGGRVFHVHRCSSGSTRTINHIFPHHSMCSPFCYNGGACDTTIPVVWNNDSYCCHDKCFPNNYPTHYGYCCELRKLYKLLIRLK